MNESKPNPNWVNAEEELNVITRNGMFQIKGDKCRRIVQNFETGEFLLGEEVSREQVWLELFLNFQSFTNESLHHE
jgi:hypothetical protein